MPATVKLSQRFYEVFGEDVTQELVDWFNAVDATYRADLRELNELNFSRFDAKLEQRLAQSDAKWEQRLAQFDAKLDRSIAELRGDLRVEIAAVESRLIKWMFAFWAPTAIGVVALLLRR